MRMVRLTVEIPSDSAKAALRPEIEAEVQRRVRDAVFNARRRDETEAISPLLASAIDPVIKAVTRYENSRFTRDETSARDHLVATCLGLRKAREAYIHPLRKEQQ